MIPQALCTSLLGCVHLHAAFSQKQRLAYPARVSKYWESTLKRAKMALSMNFDKEFFSKGAR
jgi:hypothetical protein